MSEFQNAQRMLDAADNAADVGDFASADELLRGAARIQEAELGPLHPDLANTLNNLAIVAEKIGRPDDAETFYRRATAIASASLPADHPVIAASRRNLEDFCRARGLPIDVPAVVRSSARDTELGLDAFVREDAAGAVTTLTGVQAADADLTPQTALPSSGTAWPVPRPPTPTTPRPLPPAPRRASRLAWLAIGVVVLVTAALLVRQPWSSRETLTAAPTGEPAAPQAAEAPLPPPAEPALPPPAELPTTPAPIEQGRPPTVAPRGNDREVVSDTPAAPAPSSGAITLAAAQLCQTFSMNGASWRCDPAGDSVAPGPVVFYTRIRSARDAAVVHRWYRGETLRRSVRLTIRANATEGYRTYSLQTVDGGRDWRVEVRSANGDLLHEQRFAVR